MAIWSGTLPKSPYHAEDLELYGKMLQDINDLEGTSAQQLMIC